MCIRDRIPSHLGYRVYIDHLMGKSSIPAEEQRYLDGMLLLNAYEPERLLENVSQVLAGMTQCAAVSTTPSGSEAIIRGVQFVQTSRRTAMVILMTSAGTMKNRIFRCDFDITPEMMRIFFRVLNQHLAGLPVAAVTPGFIQSLGASLGEMCIRDSSKPVTSKPNSSASSSKPAEMCIRDRSGGLYRHPDQRGGLWGCGTGGNDQAVSLYFADGKRGIGRASPGF